MKMEIKVLILVTLIYAATCLPLGGDGNDLVSSGHRLWKRFINPSIIFGNLADSGINKIRTKRSSEDECEKLQLCKLHARSRYSFFAAYELYFVNKENARLWDHQPHSAADCDRRFGACYR